MNTEFLLDAIGLLDDGLIREAEEYIQPRTRFDYRRWAGLAACAVLVLALGYGVTQLNMAGKSNNMSSGAAGEPAASAPASGEVEDSDWNGMDIPGTPEPDNPLGDSGLWQEEGCPAIMVDGVLYWSTGRQISDEPDPSAIKTAVSYTSGVPEMDGQTNFSEDLSAQYAMTGQGLVVKMDGTWILFDTVPPEA